MQHNITRMVTSFCGLELDPYLKQTQDGDLHLQGLNVTIYIEAAGTQ